MNSIIQDMKSRQSLLTYAQKYSVSRASRKYNKSRSYIYFWLARYTAIDEYSRYRVLGAYEEQSTFSSADFLCKVVAHFARKGIVVECVQTDNGFEFTNRFSNSKRDLETRFEARARELGIQHKLIRPYTPRHNGKVERSHREDQKRFYSSHRFFSLADFGVQLAAHQSRSNSRPMRPLHWAAPRDVLSSFTVQYV